MSQAVLKILAGTSIADAAASAGTPVTVLAEAVETFVAAGHAALCAQVGHEWFHARIEFTRWENAETCFTSALGPALCELRDNGIITRWWFIRKHPCWRLRMRAARTSSHAQITSTLDKLTASAAISAWRRGIYEPETAAFGGPVGIGIIHDLHSADSACLLDYLTQPSTALGRKEISMLLCAVLFNAAGLDSFEQADTWHRVTMMRPEPGSIPARLADKLRTLLTIPISADAPFFRPEHPAAPALAWATAFSGTEHQLRQQAAEGALDRGLRSILAHIVIFHWNRLGLPASTQAILAHAARQALLPAD